MLADDETNITEIELLMDGRICVFGTSLEVLTVLDALQRGSDIAIQRRMTAGSEGRSTKREVHASLRGKSPGIPDQIANTPKAES